MQFRIADTFTDSLAKLTGDEQKAVKTAAFDLQMNPAHPGLKLHQVDRAKDKDFWSVRVSRDIRLIVHRTASSFLLCYVDHHDAAYQWAERRRLEPHPMTGAAQLVEIRETVREIQVPRYVQVDVPASSQDAVAGGPTARTAIFAGASNDDLLSYGVPVEWLDDVRAATEDSLLDLADHLPGEAAEALLQLATGGAPDRPAPAAAGADPFAHPDAQRRFRVMADVDALERALDYPWEKWTVFLHPAQRQLVEREYRGPARVSGSAGTGKTIVALHRAVHLARAHPESRVLLATFSDALAAALANPPQAPHRERAEDRRASRSGFDERHRAPPLRGERRPPQLGGGRRHPGAAPARSSRCRRPPLRCPLSLDGMEHGGRRLAARELGGLPRRAAARPQDPVVREAARAALVDLLAGPVCARRAGEMTEPGMFARVAAKMAEAPHPPFDFYVIDEAQDVGVAELQFLAALGGGRPNSLFFAGDLGQRIFQTPFSWRALGVDVRGRSHTLRINYRTSHQIRRQADRLLPPELADVDGNAERRGATVSVFNGPAPEVRTFDSPEDETEAIADWLRARQREGYAPQAIGVFVRSPEADRAGAVGGAGSGHAIRAARRRVRRRVRVGRGRHHAPRQGAGVPGGRGGCLRRGGHSSAGTDRTRRETPISRRSTVPSGIFSTLPAPAHATGYW